MPCQYPCALWDPLQSPISLRLKQRPFTRLFASSYVYSTPLGMVLLQAPKVCAQHLQTEVCGPCTEVINGEMQWQDPGTAICTRACVGMCLQRAT